MTLLISNKDTVFLVSNESIEYYDLYSFQKKDSIFFTSSGTIYQIHVYTNDYLVWTVMSEVFVMNINTKEIKKFLFNDDSSYGCVLYQNYLIPSERNQVSLWDIDSQTLIRSYKVEDYSTKFCIGCMRNTYLSGFDSTIQFFDFSTQETIAKTYGSEIIFNMDVDEKLGLIAYGTFNGELGVVDFETKNLLHTYKLKDSNSIQSICIFEDTFCAYNGHSSYLYHCKRKEVEVYQSLCTFSKSGDLILKMKSQPKLENVETNGFKTIRISRPSKFLEKVMDMKSWDLSFHFY